MCCCIRATYSRVPVRFSAHSQRWPRWTGASLYFTFLARQAEDPIAQWLQVKTAASQAIVDGGGTITHHHGVGRDHAPWIGSELGDEGVAALRALKAELDPKGIMNPGKLLA